MNDILRNFSRKKGELNQIQVGYYSRFPVNENAGATDKTTVKRKIWKVKRQLTKTTPNNKKLLTGMTNSRKFTTLPVMLDKQFDNLRFEDRGNNQTENLGAFEVNTTNLSHPSKIELRTV